MIGSVLLNMGLIPWSACRGVFMDYNLEKESFFFFVFFGLEDNNDSNKVCRVL